MFVSKRIEKMQESPIRKLAPLALEAKNKGKKIYHLNIGQPDIKTPKEFFEAIGNFDSGVLEYSYSQGIPELIKSFVKYYKQYNLNYGEEDILITNGGSEAIIFALIACCDDGDEVLIPEPFYANYNSFSTMAGVNVVPITTKAEEGFNLPAIEEIEKLVTNRTKAIMINNPSNPTGKVYTKEEIFLIRDLAIRHNLYIISDEVYREFVYDGLEYVSFGSIKELEDRVIIIDSISKRYSACGARIGCVVSKNKDIIYQILKLCQSRLCVATLEQLGAAKLVDVSKSYMEEVYEEYNKRRMVVFDALNNMEGVICKIPKGAFYVTAKLPVDDAEDFAKWLLSDFDVNGETVMVAPASGFYSTEGMGKDEVRISYVLKIEDLEKAMNVIKEGLKAYK
jgi:aspartate aminotransferase